MLHQGLVASITSIVLLAICQAKNISFITYFDCGNMTTIGDIEDCDVLAYLGAQVAKDAINSDLESKNYLDFEQVEIRSRISSEVSLWLNFI